MFYLSYIRPYIHVAFLSPSAEDIDFIAISILLPSLLSLTLKITFANRSKCDNKPTAIVLFMLLRGFL